MPCCGCRCTHCPSGGRARQFSSLILSFPLPFCFGAQWWWWWCLSSTDWCQPIEPIKINSPLLKCVCCRCVHVCVCQCAHWHPCVSGPFTDLHSPICWRPKTIQCMRQHAKPSSLFPYRTFKIAFASLYVHKSLRARCFDASFRWIAGAAARALLAEQLNAARPCLLPSFCRRSSST